MKFSLSLSGSVPAPGQPLITAVSATSTSISLSWSLPSDSVVDSSEVVWQEISNAMDSDGNGTSESTGGDKSSGTSGSITDTRYTIKNLTNGTSYIITVTVTSVAGSTVSHPIIITTLTGM